jgi:hypothetical protein
LLTGRDRRFLHGSIETTLTVNTVERADFSIHRKQIYA